MFQAEEIKHKLNIVLGEKDFAQNSKLNLQLKFQPEKNNTYPEMECHPEYYFICRIKLKEGVNEQQADIDFKAICKSIYVLLTSFVKQIRDFLKPTFQMTYLVDKGYAYINIKITKESDVQIMLNILQIFCEGQNTECLRLQLYSDVIVNELGKDINTSIKSSSASLDLQMNLSKQLQSNLISLIQQNIPQKYINKNKNKYKRSIYLYQMLQKADVYLEMNKLNLNLGIKKKQFELPFKVAIYAKVERFAQTYLANQIEFDMCTPQLQINVSFQYQGELFSLIENMLIIKK